MKFGSKEAPSKSSRHPLFRRIPFPVKLNKQIIRALLPVAAAGLFALTPVQAAIISTGDIIPVTDPSTWMNGTSGTTAYIGNSGNGAVTVNGGSSMTAFWSYIGNNAGSSGTVNVTGPGSSWTGNSVIYNGYGGTGAMNITNGGIVSVKETHFGSSTGSSGSAIVDGSGSALNVTYGLFVADKGSGTLNITNGGNVAASGFRLGEGAGSTGTVNISGACSKLSVINLPTNNPPIYVGYYGNGVISVKNGGTLETSASVQLGVNSTASGIVNIDGSGSSWVHNAVDAGLTVGGSGKGSVNITNGGAVTTNAYGVIVGSSFGTGIVNVSGSGSKWNINIANFNNFSIGQTTGILNITNGGNVTSSGSDLTVGTSGVNGGSGTVYVNGSGSSLNLSNGINLGSASIYSVGTGRLIIRDGATANATKLNINSTSLLTTDLGRGSSVTIGNGTGFLTNNGTIRLVAGAGTANGTYKPVSAGTWSGSGTLQALGGIWDSISRTVTVSNAAIGAAGTALTADLSNTQRFLFNDGSTGKSVGAAFQSTTGSTNLTMKATDISGSELTSLQSLLGTGEAVLSGWDFTTSGYTTGNPVYLSLFAGSGQSLSDLNIWHYDGTAWGKFTASDLAYDNTYASFTVTGFSGYAVSGTAPVPVPAALWLLGSGVIGLVGIRRRKIAC